jgi:hypothetical protein
MIVLVSLRVDAAADNDAMTTTTMMVVGLALAVARTTTHQHNQLKETDDHPKETKQLTTCCSKRNICGGGNIDSGGNGNGSGSGNDDDNFGRQLMGRQVWGRCQAAEGSRAKMGTKWV